MNLRILPNCAEWYRSETTGIGISVTILEREIDVS